MTEVKCYKDSDGDIWIDPSPHGIWFFDVSHNIYKNAMTTSNELANRIHGCKDISPAKALSLLADWPEGLAKAKELLGEEEPRFFTGTRDDRLLWVHAKEVTHFDIKSRWIMPSRATLEKLEGPTFIETTRENVLELVADWPKGLLVLKELLGEGKEVEQPTKVWHVEAKMPPMDKELERVIRERDLFRELWHEAKSS